MTITYILIHLYYLQLGMDCAESSCDTVRYETFPVRTVTSFVKITLEEKCAINGVGGFREIRALSTAHDGKIS